MSDKNSPAIEQIITILNNSPTAIYVSAIDNYELLYINEKARDILASNSTGQERTCYEAAGFTQPCSFCQTSKMSRDKFLVREFQLPIDSSIYQLSGKIIDWDGREAHIEYITDITERKKEENKSKAVKEELQTTFSCIPCGLCVYKFENGKISPLFHNPAFYGIMGYSKEHIKEIENDTSFLGVHPDDLPVLQSKIQDAILKGGLVQYIYRVWNDNKNEYRWIRLDGSVETQADNTKFLYGVYSDVNKRVLLEQELTAAKDKMQDIINAIPGGVAIYKVSDIFETIYFSDGVPELSGYTVEEYHELIKEDAAKMTYYEDTEMVVSNIQEAIKNHTVTEFDFRKQHRDGHIVWVHVQAKQIGEEDGCPLIHCVFHNISNLKETQLELDHLVNSIPGGIASYRIEDGQFIPIFFSDGIVALSGHTRKELEEITKNNALEVIYEADKKRVSDEAVSALKSGRVLDISYRVHHKDGSLVWIHLNGRRMGPLSDSSRFYAVITGMSSETRLFQSIANETADGIYVISKDTYELFYTNESKNLFLKDNITIGEKCYKALFGKSAPCEFCTLKSHKPDNSEHDMLVDGTDKFYSTRFHETDWNGISAYVKYVRDVTEETKIKFEKERLSMYFQSVVENLPGGITVIRYESDNSLIPEYISEGFASMCHMTVEEVENVYKNDIFASFHSDDSDNIKNKVLDSINSGNSHCELTGRLKLKDGGYIWVKSTISLIHSLDGVKRLYTVHTDISKSVEEKDQLRQQYENILLQHYQAPGPDTLILGHCNITKNKILEIIDYTDSDLLKTFGYVRNEFFSGIAGLVTDENEHQQFLDTYLNKPSLEAYLNHDTEKILKCFVKLPKEEKGRYVQFKVNMIEAPDSGDITGILTVTDITEQTISDRILHQLSITSYDYVIDLNLSNDSFTVLSCNKNAHCAPPKYGRHSQRVLDMVSTAIVPKDKAQYSKLLEPDEIRQRLKKEGSYTFAYAISDEKGDIRSKNMTVSAIDLRLDRVSLVCSDITDSVREQQGLLNMIAYTFDLACLFNIDDSRLTLYTRQIVLENLTPYIIDDYDKKLNIFANQQDTEKEKAELKMRFTISSMIKNLSKKPSGYDFVYPQKTEDGLRYKQINVLWGDENHRTICMVRADVTDMLAAERHTKETLERALELAEEANKAKSDFLSTMSHDIRTPMNAIIGMTTLAEVHLDNREKVLDCLKKISVSSKHLLSLVNDILDMSKIERSKIAMNIVPVYLPDLINQIAVIIEPQAKEAGLKFNYKLKEIKHNYFLGDSLRINQILINILNNAVKFNPFGGKIDFTVEEIPALKTNNVRFCFTVSDTGVGMSEEFLKHIFDPFARDSSAAKIEGTGLGLSITKGLVELMNGKISVDSKPDIGSTFKVELEYKINNNIEKTISKNNTEDSIPKDKNLFLGRRFLIAEDNDINAEILCGLLDLYGAEYTVEENGEKAVSAFSSAAPGTYDAIIMDIQMPKMNGYEATRAIRNIGNPESKTIPIIAMTANAFAEDIQSALDSGMNAHISKPVDVSILLNTLNRLLKNNKDG